MIIYVMMIYVLMIYEDPYTNPMTIKVNFRPMVIFSNDDMVISVALPSDTSQTALSEVNLAPKQLFFGNE